jgi:hypothetical protein
MPRATLIGGHGRRRRSQHDPQGTETWSHQLWLGLNDDVDRSGRPNIDRFVPRYAVAPPICAAFEYAVNCPGSCLNPHRSPLNDISPMTPMKMPIMPATGRECAASRAHAFIFKQGFTHFRALPARIKCRRERQRGRCWRRRTGCAGCQSREDNPGNQVAHSIFPF